MTCFNNEMTGEGKGRLMRWQPIKTAPKDWLAPGIIVGMGHKGSQECWTTVTQASWDEDLGKWTTGFSGDGAGSMMILGYEPTHWMLLPKPPKIIA